MHTSGHAKCKIDINVALTWHNTQTRFLRTILDVYHITVHKIVLFFRIFYNTTGQMSSKSQREMLYRSDKDDILSFLVDQWFILFSNILFGDHVLTGITAWISNRIHGFMRDVITPLIARFMGPTWGPSGADRTQVCPMLVPWTLLSGSSIT